MITEAPAIIKLGQDWQPFANQQLEETGEAKIFSPLFTLEGYGQLRAELIPFETVDRFHAMPLKELQGRERLELKDITRQYMVRLVLSTEATDELWEDKGEGISVLKCILPVTDQGQPIAQGELYQSTGNGQLEISFENWLLDPSKPPYDWANNRAYGFNLTTGLDGAPNCTFTFGKSEAPQQTIQ